MGVENKGDRGGESSKKHLTQSSSPKDQSAPIGSSSFLSPPPPPPPPLYTQTTSSLFDQQPPFELGTNPKRPRYTASQWKLLPSPPQKQTSTSISTPHPHQKVNIVMSNESTPSPSQLPVTTKTAPASSSSDTAASSPSHPSLSGSAASAGQDYSNKTNLDSSGRGEEQQYQQQSLQFRKGKYVSPVWKPNEMLWLAKAWRVQYQGSSSSSSTDHQPHPEEGGAEVAPSLQGRGTSKTRADKDREVAVFLNRNGVNRDAKTAGTKWDNMLGEFRKVYEWERGGEREQMGKSYFRLSPYERKLHRLPASFDEQVFEELSQFMGSKMRASSCRPLLTTCSAKSSPFISVTSTDHHDIRSSLMPSINIKPPPPPFREDKDVQHLSAGRGKQLLLTSGGEAYRSLLGYDTSSSQDVTTSSKVELRRIGKVRMVWEESVSLWAEEGEHHRGRVKVKGCSFLNADELFFLDDSMVACTMEAFEEAATNTNTNTNSNNPLKGFSVDRFVCGQQVKVFGRRKSSNSPSAASSLTGFHERIQHTSTEPSIRSIPPWEYQDPSEYYVGCLKIPPPTLPSLVELPWHLQEPPPEELRFPLRKDVYRELPQGKEIFFTTSNELLDCRAITLDILSPIIRPNPTLTASSSTSRDSFIGLWDDCINRVVSKFCPIEIDFIRKPSSDISIQDQWPNVTAFLRNFCLWRGEETDQLREGHVHPSNAIVDKLSWTYNDLPYILGYYAVGYIVTFCAFSRSHDNNTITRTDLYTIDLSSPGERLKALIPCWRIAGLLPLLADRCFNCINNIIGNSNLKNLPYSDYERTDLGNGNIVERTPNTVTRYFSSKRKWGAVKEIYDFLDHRIPHSEFIVRYMEKDLSLTFKPRGCKLKPINCDQLIEALKYVTKALVALHDLSFMHRDLGWDKVMMMGSNINNNNNNNRENEWFVTGFDEAVGAPQIYPHVMGDAAGSGRHAPEMGRGLHGVKVDVWGVGQLVKGCGLVGIPKQLRELQNRCLEQNPEQRPTAADCYHHLLQLQSSMSSAAGGGVY